MTFVKKPGFASDIYENDPPAYKKKIYYADVMAPKPQITQVLHSQPRPCRDTAHGRHRDSLAGATSLPHAPRCAHALRAFPSPILTLPILTQ